MTDDETFHAGEQAMQTRAGVRERMAQAGPKVIRRFMPDQHRDFFAVLPWMLVGYADGTGQPWAAALTGAPGFVVSPDPGHLVFSARPGAADGLADHVGIGTRLGLLGLQPHTRRRNRMNGHVTALSAAGFTVEVDQSFGNCPQYIQARSVMEAAADWTGLAPRRMAEADTLSAEDLDLIAAADTFFVATRAEAGLGPQERRGGLDVSHRGGMPGFLKPADDRTLYWPDYRGNFFFNTLGNILADPRCGLLVPDFHCGGALQIAGRGEVLCPANLPAGVERLVRFEVTAVRRLAGYLPAGWDAPGFAPQFDNLPRGYPIPD